MLVLFSGEDRWLCTLMIERGWRLDYCASSVDSTYCPDNFDEFFKQRRRWGPSTLANQTLLIQTQAKIRRSNDDVNMLFIVYQVLLFISTLIGWVVDSAYKQFAWILGAQVNWGYWSRHFEVDSYLELILFH